MTQLYFLDSDESRNLGLVELILTVRIKSILGNSDEN